MIKLIMGSIFEITEPIPNAKRTHAFSITIPWTDASYVGSSVLRSLMHCTDAKEVGRLKRPGNFFDFTRYRPMLSVDDEGKRETGIPNTHIYHARYSGKDYLFLRCLEPHRSAEEYANSIIEILEQFNTERYCTLGSMYGHQSHTRPLGVSGTSDREHTRRLLEKLGVRESGYQGPTTPLILVSEEARKRGMETMGMIVHLPLYLQTEEDYMGQYTLLRLVCSLYNFPINLDEIKGKGEKLYRELDMAAENDPRLKDFIQRLEAVYDSQQQLSPEMDSFMRDISGRFSQN